MNNKKLIKLLNFARYNVINRKFNRNNFRLEQKSNHNKHLLLLRLMTFLVMQRLNNQLCFFLIVKITFSSNSQKKLKIIISPTNSSQYYWLSEVDCERENSRLHLNTHFKKLSYKYFKLIFKFWTHSQNILSTRERNWLFLRLLFLIIMMKKNEWKIIFLHNLKAKL